MFLFYTGKPGTGKSYKVVYDLFSVDGKYYVLHNIDGLKHDHFKHPHLFRDWREFVDDYNDTKSVLQIFNEEWQKDFCARVNEKYGLPVLVIVDEAHRWFDKTKKAAKAWLSFHRHLGQDIWFVTQKQTMIATDYRGLAELEKRAKNTFLFNLPFYFVYQKRSGPDSCGYEKARKSKKVFSAYKSFELTTGSKQRSWFAPALIGFVALCVGYYFFWDIGPATAKNEPSKAQKARSGPGG